MVPESGLTPDSSGEPTQPQAQAQPQPTQPSATEPQQPIVGWGQPVAPGYPPSGYPGQQVYPPSGYPAQPGFDPSGYPGQQGYSASGYPPGYYYQMPGGQPAGFSPQYPPAPEQKPSALPVEPKAFHEFYRAPRFRWWKPLASIGLIAVAWFLESLLLVGIALAADLGSGRLADVTDALTTMTPLMFLANNVSLGVLIPLAVLTSWLVFGQRPRWLTSIVGGFRWPQFAQFALIAVVPLLAALILGGFEGLAWNADSVFLIVAVLLTTPFQAAGEEYLVRGLLARSIGSWFTKRWLGFGVATVVTSVIFMLLHGAGDPWLNSFYFTFGVVASVITWRTGGLEAAIALHVVNNLIGEVSLPFGSLEHLMDRQAGVAGPEVLVQLAMLLLVGGLIYWWAGRRKLSTTAAPLVDVANTELS